MGDVKVCNIKDYIFFLKYLHYSLKFVSVIIGIIHTAYLVLFLLMCSVMGMFFRIPMVVIYAVPVYIFIIAMYKKINLKEHWRAIQGGTYEYREYIIQSKDTLNKTIKTDEQGELGCLLQDDFKSLEIGGRVGYIELYTKESHQLIGRFYIRQVCN